MLLNGIYESSFYWSLHSLWTSLAAPPPLAQCIEHNTYKRVHKHFTKDRQTVKFQTASDKEQRTTSVMISAFSALPCVLTPGEWWLQRKGSVQDEQWLYVYKQESGDMIFIRIELLGLWYTAIRKQDKPVFYRPAFFVFTLAIHADVLSQLMLLGRSGASIVKVNRKFKRLNCSLTASVKRCKSAKDQYWLIYILYVGTCAVFCVIMCN